MDEWEEAMDARPAEEKQSGQGKRAAVVQKQAAEHIKPLLRQLKKRVSAQSVVYSQMKLELLSLGIVTFRHWSQIFLLV